MTPTFISEPINTEIELGDTNEDMYKELGNNPRYGGAVFDIIQTDNFGYPKKKNLLNNDISLGLKDDNTVTVTWTPENRLKYVIPHENKGFDNHTSVIKQSKNESISLEGCLDLFTHEEQLGPNDTWYCTECKEHLQAYKKFDIWSMPPLLIIHLKRFSYYKGIFREKLDAYVDFPDELDLSPRIQNDSENNAPLLYDLYAISNHYGNLGGGHYTAYCKHRDGTWFSFDDSSVSSTTSNGAKTKAAYVLFYKKRDFEFKPFNIEWDKKPSESSSDSDEDEAIDTTLKEYIDAIQNNTQEPTQKDDNHDNIPNGENHDDNNLPTEKGKEEILEEVDLESDPESTDSEKEENNKL